MRFSISLFARTSGTLACHACPRIRPVIARWRVALTVFLAVTMFVTAGCGIFHRTVKGIPEDEAAAVRSGKKSVVLFRLAPRMDNAPVIPVDKVLDLDFPFFMFWADIDRREDPRMFPAFSPSPAAAAENWVYYVVPPGDYWIGILGHDSRRIWKDANYRKNNFFLEVPRGIPLLYAGTLSADCKSRWGFFGRLPDRCGHIAVEDESAAAGILARRDLDTPGTIETVLVRSAMPEPAVRERPEFAPMGVVLKGSPPLLSPEWKKRGIGRATGLGSESVMGMLGEPPPAGGSLSSFEAHVYLGYVLYLPVGAVAGLIGGEHSQRKWAPCMNTIAANVADWSPPDAFRGALVEALARRGVEDVTVVDNAASVIGEDGQPRFRTLFEVEIQEVVFRECGTRWTFCGELKVRGLLRDLARGRILYDGVLVHSNGSRRFPFFELFYTRPYEWLVGSDAPCRAIEKYCDPEGAALLIADLDSAVQLLAQRLVQEAGLPNGLQEESGDSSRSDVRSSPMSSILPDTP